MNPKNKTPTEAFKFDIIELRLSIVQLKEQKNLTDIEILRYVYQNLGNLLTKNY